MSSRIYSRVEYATAAPSPGHLLRSAIASVVLVTLSASVFAAQCNLVGSVVADGLLPANTASDKLNGVNLCSPLSAPGCDGAVGDVANGGVLNGVVRTHDTIRYGINYNVIAGPAQPVIVVKLPAGTGQFSLPGTCQNPVTATNAPGATQSALTLDGSGFQCVVANVVSTASVTFTADFKVSGSNANGAVMAPTMSVLPASSGCTASTVSNPSAVAVTAAPRFDLAKYTTATPGLVKNASNQTVWRQSFSIVVGIQPNAALGVTSLPTGLAPEVGAEALNSSVTVTDITSGLPGNPTLFDCSPQGANGTPNGGVGGGATVSGSTTNWTITGSSTDSRSVISDGHLTCTQPGGAGSNIVINFANANTTLDRWPTFGANSPLAVPYVDAKVALAAVLYVDLDPAAFPAPGPAGTIPYTNTAQPTNWTSLSGQANFNQNTADDSVSSSIPASQGYFDKYWTKSANAAVPLPGAVTVIDTKGVVSAGGQLSSRIVMGNSGTQPFTAGQVSVCDIWDNSKTQLTTNPFAQAAHPHYFFQEYGILPTPSPTFVVEYGAATSGSWPPASYPAVTATNAECNAATGWYADPTAVPGGMAAVTKLRIRATTGGVPAGYFPVFYFTYTPAPGLTTGTLLPNQAVFDRTGSATSYSAGAFDPVADAAAYTRAWGGTGVVRFANAVVRMTKDTNPTSQTSIAAPNGVANFVLTPTLVAPVSGLPTITDVVAVYDLLPLGLDYVAGSAAVGNTPTEPTIIPCTGAATPDARCTAAGQTLLTWNLGVQNTAVAVPQVKYQARTNALPANGSSLLNVAVASSPSDASTLADRTGAKTLTVTVPQELSVSKTTSTPQVPTNGAFQYTVTYLNATTSPIAGMDIIDILPFNGDSNDPSRTPPSAFAGTSALAGVAASTVTATWYFSNAAPATLSSDPTSGVNANALPNATWCAGTVAGPAGTCGFTLAQATAVRFIDGASLPSNTSRTLTLNMTSSGNTSGNLYTNVTGAKGQGIALPALSNPTTVRVFLTSIAGTVFRDANANGGVTGYLSAEDVGLPGVAVAISGGKAATAVTSATQITGNGVLTFPNVVGSTTVQCIVPVGMEIAVGGYYFCDLPPGTYSVVETQPSGYVTTGNKAGSAGGTVGALGGATESITNITLGTNASATGYDFGEIGATTVSGRVYVEASNPANTTDNGNANDPGLVTQVAISCTPAYTGMTPMNTAADGSYTFSNVPAGANCTITETQPAGYTNAYNTPGTGGTSDSGGTAGSSSNSTITLTVPAAGSTGNNFAEQSADMVPTFSNIPAAVAPGASYTGLTLTCTNNGPGAAVAGSCVPSTTTTGATVSAVNCTPSAPATVGATAPNNSIACTFSYKAPDMAGGVDSPTQTVALVGTTGAVNDSNGGIGTGGNNQVVLSRPVIDAVNDAPATQQYSATGSTSYPLLGNDQLGTTSNPTVGTAAGQVAVTLQNNGGITGASIDATGSLVVPNNTPPGTYTVTYQICTATGLAAPQDQACDTATKPITILGLPTQAVPVIDARLLLLLSVLLVCAAAGAYRRNRTRG